MFIDQKCTEHLSEFPSIHVYVPMKFYTVEELEQALFEQKKDVIARVWCLYIIYIFLFY